MRPRSPSPEIDVDGERGTPEPDFGPEEEAKDEESQGIISQLEKGVPRWAGLEDIGWCDTLNQVSTCVKLSHQQF
jgi:chromatin structure-remodeling complex subunit RSC1/2